MNGLAGAREEANKRDEVTKEKKQKKNRRSGFNAKQAEAENENQLLHYCVCAASGRASSPDELVDLSFSDERRGINRLIFLLRLSIQWTFARVFFFFPFFSVLGD